MRGIVGLRVRATMVKRREHMSMTAWGSTEGGCSCGDVGVDGDDEAVPDTGNKAAFRQPNRSLTMASVTACGVPSAETAGTAAANASNVAALSSIAKSSMSGSNKPLKVDEIQNLGAEVKDLHFWLRACDDNKRISRAMLRGKKGYGGLA